MELEMTRKPLPKAPFQLSQKPQATQGHFVFWIVRIREAHRKSGVRNVWDILKQYATSVSVASRLPQSRFSHAWGRLNYTTSFQVDHCKPLVIRDLGNTYWGGIGHARNADNFTFELLILFPCHMMWIKSSRINSWTMGVSFIWLNPFSFHIFVCK